MATTMIALSFKQLELQLKMETARVDEVQRQLLEAQDRNGQLDTLLKARRARIADLEVSLQTKNQLCEELQVDNVHLATELETAQGLVLEFKEAAVDAANAKSVIAKLQSECDSLHEQVADFARIRLLTPASRKPTVTFRTLSVSGSSSHIAISPPPRRLLSQSERSVQTEPEAVSASAAPAVSDASSSDSMEELLRSESFDWTRPIRRRPKRQTVGQVSVTARPKAPMIGQGTQTRRPYLEVALNVGCFENSRSNSRSISSQTRDPEAPLLTECGSQSDAVKLRVEGKIGNFVSPNFRSTDIETTASQTVTVICATRATQYSPKTQEISVQFPAEGGVLTQRGKSRNSATDPARSDTLAISSERHFETSDNLLDKKDRELQSFMATARQVSVHSEKVVEKYQTCLARYEQNAMEKEDLRLSFTLSNRLLEQLIDKTIENENARSVQQTDHSTQTDNRTTQSQNSVHVFTSTADLVIPRSNVQTQCRPTTSEKSCNTEILDNFRSPRLSLSIESIPSSIPSVRPRLEIFKSPRVKLEVHKPVQLLNSYTTSVQTDETMEDSRRLRDEISVQRNNFLVKVRGMEQMQKLEMERARRESTLEIGNLKQKHEEEVRAACAKTERKFQLKQEKRVDVVPLLEKIGKSFSFHLRDALADQQISADPISRRIVELFLQLRAEAFAKGRNRGRKFHLAFRGFVGWRVAFLKATQIVPAKAASTTAKSVSASLPTAVDILTAQTVQWDAQLRRELATTVHRTISFRKYYLWSCIRSMLFLYLLTNIATVSGNLRLLSPASLAAEEDGFIESSTATFGAPKYGEHILGTMHSPDSASLHCSDDYAFPPDVNTDFHVFLLTERGGCSFKQKVALAEKKGYNAVVISQDDPHMFQDLSTLIPADDGRGGDVHIPSVVVSHWDGRKMRREITQSSELIIAELSWSIPPQNNNKLRVDLWLNPASERDHRMITRMKPFISELYSTHGNFLFLPHYTFFPVPADSSQKLCLDDLGEFCADGDQGVQGGDVAREQLRLMCIRNWSFNNTAKALKSLDYLERSYECKGRGFSGDCSDKIMAAVGIDRAEISKCIQNPTLTLFILQLERASQAWSSHAVRINGFRYDGEYSSDGVRRAVCSAIPEDRKPAFCRAHAAESHSRGAFLVFGLVCLTFSALVWLLLMRNMRQQLLDVVYSQVQAEVRWAVTDRKPLMTQGP